MTVSIRPFRHDDWRVVWAILEPVFRAGETYSYATDISEADAYGTWVGAATATFVAEGESGEVVGTYYIKPNQPGQGSHVCNCGYVVAASARGKGIAASMCEHSQVEALKLGFRAMQYNLVVSTNEGAVRLWRRMGFEIVGTLPNAFRHPCSGFVNAYVMYKSLA